MPGTKIVNGFKSVNPAWPPKEKQYRAAIRAVAVRNGAKLVFLAVEGGTDDDTDEEEQGTGEHPDAAETNDLWETTHRVIVESRKPATMEDHTGTTDAPRMDNTPTDARPVLMMKPLCIPHRYKNARQCEQTRYPR